MLGGMVLEEPDIEIGAGVSSKAMSKRVLPTEAAGQGNAKRQREDSRHRKERTKRQNDGGGYGYSGVSGGK